ncbi:MAG: hypothetical protein KAS32_31685 [Candidatus Peribacteraceae bacterium]|nr:hypothetical protein [Candidatus Peribacteraceae bacterium]
MKESAGKQCNAWLTSDKKYRPSNYKPPKINTYAMLAGINNYGLYRANSDYKKTKPSKFKNYMKNDWEETKQNFQKRWKYTKTTSKAVKTAIKNTYDWLGIWGISVLGTGSGLGYVVTQHPGSDYNWLKGALMGGLLTSGMKFGKHLENKKTQREKSEIIENKKRDTLKKDFMNFMKDIHESDLGVHEKIDFKYVLRTDKLSKKLFDENGDSMDELSVELDNMKNSLNRYIHTNKHDGNKNGSREVA